MAQIIDVKAQLRSDPPAFIPTIGFNLSQQGVFCALEWSGSRFAILNKKTCRDIELLRNIRGLRLQVFVSTAEWDKGLGAWAKDRTSAVLSIDINIYGPRCVAADAGKILLSAKTFLQQPVSGLDGFVYYNPHYLHIEEVLGGQVHETPISSIEEKSQEIGQTLNEEKQQQVSDEVEIDSILNSLSHHSFLQKSIADRRIKTKLLEWAPLSLMQKSLYSG